MGHRSVLRYIARLYLELRGSSESNRQLTQIVNPRIPIAVDWYKYLGRVFLLFSAIMPLQRLVENDNLLAQILVEKSPAQFWDLQPVLVYQPAQIA